ncbi:MAG TPA: ArsR family transcriptional regulator [Candidatus Marinimicrobia bacterium]|nr:ArsR family transcriptional regulator [Candidatus Neomarinimicrobiota bacterium]
MEKEMDSKQKLEAQFLEQAAKVLKVLGHPIRIQIIEFLETGEHTVGEIQNEIDQIQAVTSQHLRLMLRKNIVKYRREGTSLRYSINSEFITNILHCIRNCDLNPASKNKKSSSAI